MCGENESSQKKNIEANIRKWGPTVVSFVLLRSSAKRTMDTCGDCIAAIRDLRKFAHLFSCCGLAGCPGAAMKTALWCQRAFPVNHIHHSQGPLQTLFWCFNFSFTPLLHMHKSFRIWKVTDWWQDKATSSKLTLRNQPDKLHNFGLAPGPSLLVLFGRMPTPSPQLTTTKYAKYGARPTGPFGRAIQ